MEGEQEEKREKGRKKGKRKEEEINYNQVKFKIKRQLNVKKLKSVTVVISKIVWGVQLELKKHRGTIDKVR